MRPLLKMPRPLRVWSRRTALGYLAWFVRCDVCGQEVRPYTPLRGAAEGTICTVDGVLFMTASAAGDEARTHLVQRHPTSPWVR